jgi:hypothetical protein
MRQSTGRRVIDEADYALLLCVRRAFRQSEALDRQRRRRVAKRLAAAKH